jgi:hypothetical protein
LVHAPSMAGPAGGGKRALASAGPVWQDARTRVLPRAA